MIRCIIQDGSTVTAGGASIVGPLQFDSDGVTVGGTVYDGGTLVVVGGSAHQVAGLAREHVLAMPYAFASAMFCGLVLAFLCRK